MFYHETPISNMLLEIVLEIKNTKYINNITKNNMNNNITNLSKINTKTNEKGEFNI